MSRNKKRKVKGRQKGKAVSPKQKEQMLQLYAIEGNYTEVARAMGLSVGCVTKHIKAMLSDPNPDIQEARARAARQLASKIDDKANKIIDSIQEHDVESGSVKIYDDDGTLQRVITYGPTLMQKVTAAAILTDKLKVLREHEAALMGERDSGRLMVPDDIQALTQGIRSKMKSLTFLNVKFEEDSPGLSERVQSKLEEAEAVDAIIEDVTIDDFDGNSRK